MDWMNDKELIAQIQGGNTNAFRFLVNQHRKLVWHMVLRMVRQHEDAEDICQEVFIRVFKSMAKYRGDSKLSTWIAAIAYNTCLDHLRKKGKEFVMHTDTLPETPTGSTSPSTPWEELQRSEVKTIVHGIIENLPLHYRTVITLFYLEEFSLQEIESITAMQEGTIKSYLHRGRKLIQEAVVTNFPEMARIAQPTNDNKLA